MCLHKKTAWREYGSTKKLKFSKIPKDYDLTNYEIYEIPCGRCVECLDKYSKQWALRCVLESQQYNQNCFLTLTYADAPKSVSKRDFQLFMKRLRKHLEPLKIRYFGCGEYGDLRGRPHYHIIIFGWEPADMYFFKTSKKGKKIYRSSFLEKIWDKGFSAIEELNFNSAKYTAIYMQKMLDNDDREKPFILMSKGLAKDSISKDLLDIGKVYYDGFGYSIPRYFIRKLEEEYNTNDYKLRKRKIAKLYSKVLDNSNEIKKEIEFAKALEKKQEIIKNILTD